MAFKVTTSKQYLEHGQTEMPMLIDGLFQQTGLVALAGGSDSGKSSFLRQLAASICSGQKEFVGFELYTRHQAVTYISTEDDDNAIASSLSRLSKKNGLNPYADKFHFVTDLELNTCIKDLDEHLQKHPCDAVIVDSVSDLMIGDMNNQTIVRTFLNKFNKIARNHDCLIIFLHHLNKSSFGSANKNQLNGSQAFEAKMRSVVILNKDENYNSLKRTLKIVKGNYTSSADKQKAIELLFDEETLSYERIGETDTTKNIKEKKEKYVRGAIAAMHKQGLPIRKIESILRSREFDIGRTKIGEIINLNKN